jgi:hypothetical protein
MARIKTLIATEYEECQAFWLWSMTQPVVRDYLIKNTNEGKRSARYGHGLKMIGMRPGLPDYHLPLSNNNYHGLWIEMKRMGSNNRKKDSDQLTWINRLNMAGHYASYAYGWENAKQIVSDYLANKL